MSRLAAVRTGQPTQGVGAAPENSAHLSVGSAVALDNLPPSLPPAAASPRSPYASQSANLTAQWLSLEAKEIEVRRYFQSLSKQAGMEMLAKMRRQCDMAASVIQQKVDDSLTERCTGCGKTLEETRRNMWIMQGSDVDPETGVPVPYRFCSPICVRERNREKMLPKELRDQKRFDGEDIAEVR